MTVQDAPRWLCLFFVHIVRHDLWLFWLLWFLWCLVTGIGHEVSPRFSAALELSFLDGYRTA
jgi:hypothetical protein